MTSLSAASAAAISMSGLMEWAISPSLTVHCFSRDGKLAGHGPLFILREWDMKVIRTIGHKPRCKGLNTEQALRACVRQGLLSLQLRTENATKDEIQLLKSVNVLGKRAPSGSLIGAADMMRLLEYFSKRDVAEAFRGVVKRKYEEGVVSDEVWKEVAGVKEREILHKFKINTDDVDGSANEADSRDDDDEDRSDKKRRSKGSAGRATGSGKAKRSSVSGGDGRRSKKRKSSENGGDADDGRGNGRSKRRRSPTSPTSLHSSSSGSSLSSLDSHNESRRKRHRNGHRRHRSDRSTSPQRGERRDKRSVDFQAEYVAMPAAADASHYNGQYEVVNGGGGRLNYAPVIRGSPQSVVSVPQNGKVAVSALQAGRGRGGPQQYYTAVPPIGGYSVAAPHTGGGSPPSYTTGLYTGNGRPASYTLSALPPHIQQSLQQYAPALSSSMHPAPQSGLPPAVNDPSLPQSDGLEVLMQVISDKGSRPTSKHAAVDPSALGQHPLVPVRGQLVTQYEQPQAQLSSTQQLYLQQQQMQQQVYLTGQSQLSPSALAYRPALLNGVKLKDSPTYLSSNAFSFNSQPTPPVSAVLKKEYAQLSNAVNASSAAASSGSSVPSPVRVPSNTLPSVQSSTSLASSLLSPGTPESSTPTSSAVHRPQPRLSPANSFNNLASLVSSSTSAPHPPITRTLSSNSLSLGLPNSSSVSSLSSLLNGSGSLSYNALHTSMSMTSLNAADVSDGDDDDGDAGINGILHFDDDIEGGGEGRGAAGYYPAYAGGSGSPLPRVSSIQSLTAAGGHSPMPRIPSNLSTLTSSFLPSPPPSRPGSPARARTDRSIAGITNDTVTGGGGRNGGGGREGHSVKSEASSRGGSS